jgi:hypothetical protein
MGYKEWVTTGALLDGVRESTGGRVCTGKVRIPDVSAVL